MADAPLGSDATLRDVLREFDKEQTAPLKAMAPDPTPNPGRCTFFGKMKVMGAQVASDVAQGALHGYEYGVGPGIAVAAVTANPIPGGIVMGGAVAAGTVAGGVGGVKKGREIIKNDCAALAKKLPAPGV